MEQSSPEPQDTAAARYAVGPPEAAGARTSLYAVFLTHGMGQQIPFQTIDHVATSLRALDVGRGNPEWKPIGRTTRSGENRLTRIELRLRSNTKPVEVHLYEGYWAPLTEGRITARNVIGFLAGAGLNGLRHTKGDLRRWLFGNYPEAPVPVRHVFFLLTALATVASLVVMNSVIAIVAASRALLGTKPSWLTDDLFADLTTTFNFVVVAMGAFGLVLSIGALMHRFLRLKRLRNVMGFITLVFFIVTVLTVILAGAGIPFLFYGHLRDLAGGLQVWPRLLSVEFVTGFNSLFDAVGLWAALAVAVVFAIRWILRITRGFLRDLQENDAKFTIVATIGFALLFAAVVSLVVFFLELFSAARPGESMLPSHLAWPLLVLASAFVRLVLVQFVGDVAIYVMPYKLDAFNDLRREIKKRVYDAAKAVYAERSGDRFAYDKVIVVGHSLGSVIAYDTLNQLILEDMSPAGPPTVGKPPAVPLRVTERTPLFLTFGSPLDKTAFLFAVQAEGTSEAREALAGSVQPLILSYANRPRRWLNIWSPWDIISGPLDLYDYPIGAKDDGNTQRVQNERDPDATTLLVAHTEYWKNPLVMETLYEAIEGA